MGPSGSAGPAEAPQAETPPWSVTGAVTRASPSPSSTGRSSSTRLCPGRDDLRRESGWEEPLLARSRRLRDRVPRAPATGGPLPDVTDPCPSAYCCRSAACASEGVSTWGWSASAGSAPSRPHPQRARRRAALTSRTPTPAGRGRWRASWARAPSRRPTQLVESGVDAARDRHCDPRARAAAAARRKRRPAGVLREAGGARPRAPRRRCIDEVERAGTLVQVGFQRRFDAGYRAAREAVAAARSGSCSSCAPRPTTPRRRRRSTSPRSGGIFRDLHIHDFDAIRFVTGEEIVEVYADGAVRETPWFAASRRRRHRGRRAAARAAARSAIVSGARHDPLGYDVRLEVFGTADSIAVGLDARTPLRSVEPGRRPPGARLPRLPRALRGRLPDRARRVRRGSARRRAEPVPPRRGARRARRRARRRPLAGRAAVPSRSRRWPARRPRQVENRSNTSDREQGRSTDEHRRLYAEPDAVEDRPTSRVAGCSSRAASPPPVSACSARPRRRRSARAKAAKIKIAVVTHGDTGSFWSVFKKGVDQAAKDLKSRGVSVTQVYANNDVAKQVAGINAAIAAGSEGDRDVRAGRERAQGPAQRGLVARASRSSPSTRASARSTHCRPTRCTSARPRTSRARAPASSSRRPARRRC